MASSVSGLSGTSVPYHSENQYVIAVPVESASPVNGELETSEIFLFTCRKIEEVFSHGAVGAVGVSHPIDPERVKVLARALLGFVQKGSEPSVDPLTQENIEEWLDAADGVEVNGVKVILLMNGKGYVASGGESCVYRGVREDGRYCAVKCLQVNNEREEIERRDALLTKICKSPYLVHYFGAVEIKREENKDEFSIDECLIEEWCCGSLEELYNKAFEDNDPVAEEQLNENAIPFIRQFLIGVSDMHNEDVVHNDLKFDNILFADGGNEIRISDLNGAVQLPATPRATTLRFSSPEQIRYLKNTFDNSEISLDYDMKKSEVWQAMLVSAQVSRSLLSQPFREEIINYINLCERIEGEACAEANGKFSNDSQPKLWAVEKAKIFSNSMHGVVEHMSKTKTGLFSDLQPTTPLETLLVGMSYFNPDQRITSAEASHFAQNHLGN